MPKYKEGDIVELHEPLDIISCNECDGAEVVEIVGILQSGDVYSYLVIPYQRCDEHHPGLSKTEIKENEVLPYSVGEDYIDEKADEVRMDDFWNALEDHR